MRAAPNLLRQAPASDGMRLPAVGGDEFLDRTLPPRPRLADERKSPPEKSRQLHDLNRPKTRASAARVCVVVHHLAATVTASRANPSWHNHPS